MTKDRRKREKVKERKREEIKRERESERGRIREIVIYNNIYNKYFYP